MKHILIVNPAAGPKNSAALLRKEAEALRASYDISIYETTGKGDATRAVRAYCEEHPEEKVRFYACGGDGTLSEVLKGLYGFPNASLSCYPCGSGNDFVKYYGGASFFSSLEALFEGEEREVDVLTDGKDFSINVANFGFEYYVCETMERLRRRPFWRGKRAYYGGIISALFCRRKNNAKVLVDGKELGKGKLLLCSVANGSYVGGSFRCAPCSDNEDGLLEVCLIDPMSALRFISLIGLYKKGTHIGHKRMRKIMHYVRAKEVEVTSTDPSFGYVIDGEIKHSMHFCLRVVPRAVRFAVPRAACVKSEENGKETEKETEKETVSV